MKLSDLSIRRPVLASMLSLALVLFGAIGYTQLAVREFPDVDPPIVSVSTALPGANPQVVESAVTDILEEEPQCAGIAAGMTRPNGSMPNCGGSELNPQMPACLRGCCC